MPKKCVPIISDSGSNEANVRAIQSALGEFGIESWRACAYALKDPGSVDAFLSITNEQPTPVITVASKADANSGYCAFRSPNPIASAMSDWNRDPYCEMYLFSSIGMHGRVPVGAVLGGPQRVAGCVRRQVNLQGGRYTDAVKLALLGDKVDIKTYKDFGSALSRLRLGVRSGRCTLDEVSDPSIGACVLFAYAEDEKQIDRVLKRTRKPVILCPPDTNEKLLFGSIYRAVSLGYYPEVPILYDTGLAAEYGAEVIGLANPRIREAVRRSKPQI